MSIVAPQLNDVYTSLKAFIQRALGPSVPVDQGIDNLVPMPVGGFVNMTVLQSLRLMTNLDNWDENDPDATDINIEQDAQLNIQLDCYGPDSSSWAAILSTLLRDDYAYQQLAPLCTPLYADDPRMIPLVNAESQYEERWLVTASIQYNPVVTAPQDFANTLNVDLINVDERFPAN